MKDPALGAHHHQEPTPHSHNPVTVDPLQWLIIGFIVLVGACIIGGAVWYILVTLKGLS